MGRGPLVAAHIALRPPLGFAVGSDASTNHPPIRAVVLDLDGTLLARDGTISAANRAAVGRLKRAGVPVILATGRIPVETVNYYRQLDLATPLVCYHGALVFAGPGLGAADPRDNRDPRAAGNQSDRADPGAAIDPAATRLIDAPLAEGLARLLVDFILSVHGDAQVLLGLADRYVINRLGTLPRHWDMSGPSRPRVQELGPALSGGVYKVCYYSPDASRVRLIMDLASREFAGSVAAHQAHAHLAELLAAGVSKAAGAEAALKALGRAWDETLAVGDYHNDAEMLHRAAVGVAMAGAPEAVRAAADFVAADCDQAGVAQALDRFVP
jgi:hydroxymethylpyrimidine pyrophosphatase-like HAD family hydrolase